MENRFLIEFSKEKPEASYHELLSVQSSSDAFTIILSNEDYSIIEGSPEPVRQCAFVTRISTILESSDSYDSFTDRRLPAGSFYLRVKDFKHCHNSLAEPEIGRRIKGDRTVSFRKPDFLVRVFHADRWYLSVVLYEKDKKAVERRRAPLRPFFSPIAIHPNYARYLVNTTRTKPGETVLDPFCGTGGILLEAALMGRRAIGSDYSLNMVKGARLNMKYFNVKDFKIEREDIADLHLDFRIDGIATDLPYGRNSNMEAESIEKLYKTAFVKFHELLRDGAVASIILSDTDLLRFTDGMFRIEKVVGIPQHRSLTRSFVTMVKT